MINPKTWLILTFLSAPVQLADILQSKSYNSLEISISIFNAALIGAFWAFVAGWMRPKFFPNLSEAYIGKVQIGLIALGIFMFGSIVYYS